MPFLGAVAIAEIGNALIFGSAIGGSIGGCFSDGQCSKRDIENRDILNTESVPRMRVKPRQAAVGPCGVPQYNFDQCNDQLKTAHITSSIPGSGQAQFDGVPPACMDLSGVLSGACQGGSSSPVPCGSACLKYSGLKPSDYTALNNALKHS